MLLPISPLGQRDNRWASQRLGTVDGVTIGSDGCIITDMAMLSTYYGHNMLPNQLDDFLTSQNLYYDGDLFVNSSISRVFTDIVFDKVVFCETYPAPMDQISAYLDQGKPVVVALLNYGVRHYILIVGYDGNKFFANDPWQGDQVAINDRWGDPATKILQVNFFSGPVPSQVQPVPVPNPTPIQPDPTPVQPRPSPVVLHPDPVPVQPQPDPTPVVPSTNLGDNPVVTVPINPAPSTPSQPVPNPVYNPSPVVTQPLVIPQNIDYGAIKAVVDSGLETIYAKLTTPRPTPSQKLQQDISFIDSLKSRKFILSVLGVIVVFINTQFHLGITQDQLMFFLLPILAFIIMEGIADIIERAKQPISV